MSIKTIKLALEALENASPAAWASRVDSDTMKSIWRKHADAMEGLQVLLEELDNASCKSVQKRLAAQQPAQATQVEVADDLVEKARVETFQKTGADLIPEVAATFARAILALRPVQVPMTDEQIRSMCKQGWVFETVRQWVHVIEAHHGITTQTKKEAP